MRSVIMLIAGLNLWPWLGAASAGTKPVWLVSNGFHSSVVVQVKDMPARIRALSIDPASEHLCIGWGAAIYYTAPRVTPFIFCRATFFPTASALHVISFRGPVERRFKNSDVFRFEIEAREMRAAANFLEAAFKRDRQKPLLLGSGKLFASRFYAGSETFWFPVTCNVWTARLLRRAGLRFGMVTSVAAPGLVSQAEKLGRRLQRRKRPVDAF